MGERRGIKKRERERDVKKKGSEKNEEKEEKCRRLLWLSLGGA